jgi:nonsense-mediated mRNA decay protein 3
MKCVKCGIRDALARGLCRECLIDSLHIEFPQSLDLQICPKCGARKLKNRWEYNRSDASIAKALESKIHAGERDASIHVDMDSISIERRSASYSAKIDWPGVAQMEVPGTIELVVSRISCPQCNKLTGSYYEAILQLRSVSEKIGLEEMLQFSTKAFSRYESIERGSFISKVEKKDEGYDIYMGNNSDAKKLASLIQDRFSTSLKVSKTLAGRKNGEDFYRYTYSLRHLGISKGAVVSYRGSPYIILEVTSGRLKLAPPGGSQGISVMKKEFLNSDYQVLAILPEHRDLIVVSRREEETEVMDPVTYSVFTVRRKEASDVVHASCFNDQYFFD